jgi:hypothetical protein
VSVIAAGASKKPRVFGRLTSSILSTGDNLARDLAKSRRALATTTQRGRVSNTTTASASVTVKKSTTFSFQRSKSNSVNSRSGKSSSSSKEAENNNKKMSRPQQQQPVAAAKTIKSFFERIVQSTTLPDIKKRKA